MFRRENGKTDWFAIWNISLLIVFIGNAAFIVGRDVGRDQSYENGDYDCRMVPIAKKGASK